MKKIKISFAGQIFLIGAVLGIIFFVAIYGFSVLNFTNDAWLLTGRDLQQHYIGWKAFRSADWTFPIGMHNRLTYPYEISVLYTDSIPLFAIIFKLLSPVLPQTFQYFGLFGLTCFIMNGGIGALLVARFSRNRFVCGAGSIFFILASPVLQRLFGLLTEDSRHTSLAAHFLILAAIGIWLYKDKFADRRKAALAFSVLAMLCVLIQMYIIFMVGGIMCGYLLYCLLKDKDWKRLLVVFASFCLSFLVTFFVIGGFTNVLKATARGFGIYSANINALWNPFNYSSFFGKKPWHMGQYEGFSYLGLGIALLYLIAIVALIIKAKKMGGIRVFWKALKQKIKAHKQVVFSLILVTVIFWILALSCNVYWGERLVMWVYIPDRILDLLAVIRSSGRFMWVIMYFAMLLGIFLLVRFVKNKKVQRVLIILCVLVQIADLAKPISNIHKQYTSAEIKEEDIYAKDNFWKTKLADYKYIVYYPLGSCGSYQMLQIGTKASYFDIDCNYFYTSRFYKESLQKAEDRKNRKIFENNQLADDTVYITNYKTAHKYQGRYYFYQADNLIIATKNPVEGLKKYNDVYVNEQNPNLYMDFTYNGLATLFAHRGWNMPDYGEDGMWTTEQSVFKVYSGGAKRVHIRMEYEAGKRKGKTTVKMNGKKMAVVDNKVSGAIEFDTDLKKTLNESTQKGVNWLFLNTEKTFKVKENGVEETRGIYVKNITVTYLQ